MKILGIKVTAARVRGADALEHERRIDARTQMFTDVPDLDADGRARQSAVGELAEQGWTGDQVLELVRSWPDASSFAMSMIVSLAGRITTDGVDNPGETIAWTHAILERGRFDFVRPKPIVRSELASSGRSLPRAVELWTEAAGSRHAGLAALTTGLSLDDTRAQR
jgi:hypothetical protein